MFSIGIRIFEGWLTRLPGRELKLVRVEEERKRNMKRKMKKEGDGRCAWKEKAHFMLFVFLGRQAQPGRQPHKTMAMQSLPWRAIHMKAQTFIDMLCA